MINYVKSFEQFFEAMETWEQELILYVNVRLYPKDVYELPITEQRVLTSKVDNVTKRIAQFINSFNRKDNRSNIERLWGEFKQDKPIIAHMTGEEIRSYVYWDRATKKLLFKPDRIEKYLEYYFEAQNKVELEKEELVLQENKKSSK
jgi:hypothetical protein